MQTAESADSTVVQTLFRHNAWANLQMLQFCATLSDEQLDSTIVGTYGSIRSTLQHLVGGEVSYVGRATDKWPPNLSSREDLVGFPVFIEVARWTGAELLALALATHADSRVREVEDNVQVTYSLAGLMNQVINHATEHRTEVAVMLTQLGLQPPDMSGWRFMEETGDFAEGPAT